VAKKNAGKPAPAPKAEGRGRPDSSAAPAKGALGPDVRVRVRMYRQGLGDCFLLTFPRGAGGPLHVLLDCGVILGTAKPEAIMKQVAEDVAATTGKHLHVVVATHEHWDHLSGFIQAQDVFDDMKIDEVWFAWTEDPADELAARLRAGHSRAVAALRGVAQKLTGLNPRSAGRVGALLEFFGAAGGKGTRDALEYLAKHRSGPKVRYLRPGEPPVPLPGAGAARAFVLGPPQDEKLIKRSNPTKSGHEVYELTGLRLGPDGAFFAAALGDDAGQVALSQAFDPLFRVAPEQAKQMPFFREHYFAPKDDPKPEWRWIDADWLGAAEQLALNLDSDTNNTSLALAFELEPGGRVLLFPGDAQVGNWESWSRYSWPADRPGAAPVTAADLLRRTVLYKVGHHASHNATLRAGGLELMEDPGLVALIPVDHAMAEKKKWFGMPFPALLARLQEKARGRVLRIDEKAPAAPAGAAAGGWADFTRRVTEQKLYFDYVIDG
jgi:hypothetical protein